MIGNLSGIFVALVVPFDENGTVLVDALQKHVDFLINQGVDGFYVNGSTGESFLMTNSERKYVLEAVIEANCGRKAIINHCGAIGTELSLDLIKHANQFDIDAISSIPPFYYGFSEREIFEYYNDLANASEKPFIIYNMPKFSGVVITPVLMSELRKNPKIKGLKFTHNDFFALQQIKSQNPDLVIYNGYDEMAICGFSLGCDGAIGSTYNVIPKYILELRRLCLKNDYQAALEVQNKINLFVKAASRENKLFSMLKYMISIIEEIDYGVCRKPFARLDRSGIEVCNNIIDSIKDSTR